MFAGIRDYIPATLSHKKENKKICGENEHILYVLHFPVSCLLASMKALTSTRSTPIVVVLWICCVTALSYLNVDDISDWYHRALQSESAQATQIIDPMIQHVVCMFSYHDDIFQY